MEQYPSTYHDFMREAAGQVIAFFVDNHGGAADNEMQSDELTGLSLGKNASVSIAGTVNGDIVSNFNDATGKVEQTNLLLNPVTKLTLDDAKSIVSGGAISNVTG